MAVSVARAAIDEKNLSLLDSLQISLLKFESNRHLLTENNERLRRERQALAPGRRRIQVGEELGRQYIVQNLDSAITYYSLALSDAMAAGDKEDQLRVRLKIYSLYPLFGVVREAIDDFESIDYGSIAPSLRKPYWIAAAEMYNLIQLRYPEGTYKDRYRRKMLEAIDSLETYYDNDTPVARYLAAESKFLRGETKLAVAAFLEILPELNSNPELADNALGIVIDHYRDKPAHRQSYLSYLLWRVRKDLDRGLVRPPSLAELGQVLYDEGYESIGRECVTMALECPDRSYASTRNADFDGSDYTYILTDEASSMRRVVYILFVVGAIAVLVLALLLIRAERRRARLEADLKASMLRSKLIIKESHLTNKNLINLMFLTIEQMSDFNVYVMRKLKAGQVKDLYDEVESGSYMQRQSEKYYQEFDSTFMASFPHFLSDLNSLLVPDRQLALLPGDRLSPELRIAALIRLGMTDSMRLSRILGLSLNTIYTYRNRLRGRALKRDTFEEELQRIP